MSDKHYLIQDKIKIGDRLVHTLSEISGTITNIKPKEFEITFDNGFISNYASDVLRSVFIRHKTYIERKEQIAINQVADEIKQLFKKDN